MSPDYRQLLARLDRDLERVSDENESLRPDPAAEEVARRAEREHRAELPPHALRAQLPANADPLAPQDPERREAFARHLSEIFSRPAADPPEAPDVEGPPTGRTALSAAACSACRGSCCRSGGDHAYLTEETVARVLQTRPGLDPAQLRDEYLRRLPERTILDSCIYHGASGCGLPREMRSTTCNRHLCGKLKGLLDVLPEDSPPPVLAVLFDGGRWVRTALLDEKGARLLAEDAS